MLACLACDDSDAAAPGAGDAALDRSTPRSDDRGDHSSDGARRTIPIERAPGGQTGMEGSCLPVPEPEPFTGDDVRALIAGEHATTLAYRPQLSSPAGLAAEGEGMPMTILVELRGDPHPGERGESCSVRIDQDVHVTLRFDQPALDVTFEETLSAFDAQFAVVQVELDPEVAEALGMPAQETTLSITFDVNGVHGTIDAPRSCGSAVFPARKTCPEWPQVEIALDRERDGFRPQDALAALDAMQDMPVRWDDGTETTLSVSLAAEPERACSWSWVATYCPERLEIPVSVRVTTADGRVDSVVSGAITAAVATAISAGSTLCGRGALAGEIEGLKLIVESVVPGAELGAGFALAGEEPVGFYLRVFSGDGLPAMKVELELKQVALEVPALTAPIATTVGGTAGGCLSPLEDVGTARSPAVADP